MDAEEGEDEVRVRRARLRRTLYRPEDFKAPRKLWEDVFDDKAKERFVNNVSGHIKNCKKEEIIKRQIAIFREVSDDLANRLEKATGVKGYPGIKDLQFNGTHNGMGNKEVRNANGMKNTESITDNNGAPVRGTRDSQKVNGSNGINGNGHNSNGISAH